MADQIHLTHALDQIAACGHVIESAAGNELTLPPKVLTQIGASLQTLAHHIKLAAMDGTLVYRRDGPT